VGINGSGETQIGFHVYAPSVKAHTGILLEEGNI